MWADGANAVLVTSVENADRLGLTQRVFPTAYAELTNHLGDEPEPDVTVQATSLPLGLFRHLPPDRAPIRNRAGQRRFRIAGSFHRARQSKRHD